MFFQFKRGHQQPISVYGRTKRTPTDNSSRIPARLPGRNPETNKASLGCRCTPNACSATTRSLRNSMRFAENLPLQIRACSSYHPGPVPSRPSKPFGPVSSLARPSFLDRPTGACSQPDPRTPSEKHDHFGSLLPLHWFLPPVCLLNPFLYSTIRLRKQTKS